MKIAAVSEDGLIISQHFGRAPYYVVVTVDSGKIVAKELRDKVGHDQFSAEGHGEHHADNPAGDRRGHGFDPAAQSRHSRMIAAIQDCHVLLGRGIGAGAHASLTEAGIRPIITDIASIEEAVQAFLRGDIVDHPERLH